MIHKIIYTLLVLSTVFSLQSCRNDDEPVIPQPVEPELTGRTVLVYILSASNGLGGMDTKDINEMKDAAQNGDITDGRLILFHSSSKGTQVLQEMLPDGTLDTLKVYDPIVRPQTSERMNEVIEDLKTEAPAKDYGLILWGHGSGWLEDGLSEEPANAPQTCSYGSEYSDKYKMNMTTLARVLDGKGFSFIYFDCCYMASVEAMYQLRNVTPFIVASSAEVMGWGMPYHWNIKHFFAPDPELVEAATNTYEYYQHIEENLPASELYGKPNSYRSCTISVINTAGLDQLAAATRSIYNDNQVGIPDGYYPQSFTLSSNKYYCDFGGYVNALNPTQEQRAAFDAAISETVILQLATEKIWNQLEIREHSGLTTFIMKSDTQSDLNNYGNLDWYNDVASALIK